MIMMILMIGTRIKLHSIQLHAGCVDVGTYVLQTSSTHGAPPKLPNFPQVLGSHRAVVVSIFAPSTSDVPVEREKPSHENKYILTIVFPHFTILLFDGVTSFFFLFLRVFSVISVTQEDYIYCAQVRAFMSSKPF